QEMREEIEARRLARTVGADQGMDGPSLDGEVDTVDGDEALELLSQPARLQYRVIRHAWASQDHCDPGSSPFDPSRDYPGRVPAWQMTSDAFGLLAPFRSALLQESIDTFLAVGFEHVARHDARRKRISVCDRTVDLSIEGLL